MKFNSETFAVDLEPGEIVFLPGESDLVRIEMAWTRDAARTIHEMPEAQRVRFYEGIGRAIVDGIRTRCACGRGRDTDGDGDCLACAPLRKANAASGRPE